MLELEGAAAAAATGAGTRELLLAGLGAGCRAMARARVADKLKRMRRMAHHGVDPLDEGSYKLSSRPMGYRWTAGVGGCSGHPPPFLQPMCMYGSGPPPRWRSCPAAAAPCSSCLTAWRPTRPLRRTWTGCGLMVCTSGVCVRHVGQRRPDPNCRAVPRWRQQLKKTLSRLPCFVNTGVRAGDGSNCHVYRFDQQAMEVTLQRRRRGHSSAVRKR
ncbi:hypothetical protein HXX76_012588 [Chlamydomonas incerta]|uniref:Uncharacterized protein n=1 Tax=Chlamydomonas incerta TaxID=51695 RepID=A0A835SHG1_CHLIN|nr:hypothetical protein HXX76_012588 [Chlamydomonas incerta]|eukprot:KAG2427074.1 hypothetical protein HXX76_012588 [Chlamydomonas incerta]